jgi:hypothetical protein
MWMRGFGIEFRFILSPIQRDRHRGQKPLTWLDPFLPALRNLLYYPTSLFFSSLGSISFPSWVVIPTIVLILPG